MPSIWRAFGRNLQKIEIVFENKTQPTKNQPKMSATNYGIILTPAESQAAAARLKKMFGKITQIELDDGMRVGMDLNGNTDISKHALKREKNHLEQHHKKQTAANRLRAKLANKSVPSK